jgi:hypothetical protein
MSTYRKINGLNSTLNKGPATFKHEQVDKALLEIQDTLERCLIPFILLEGAAKQLYEGIPFELKELSLGIKEKEFTQSGKGIFKILRPDAEISNDNIALTVNGVPTVIWIIHRNYKFFEHPDFKWYARTEFFIPNPFGLYWKSRFLIR